MDAKKAPNLTSKSGRAALEPRREPYWSRLSAGLFLGYRVADSGAGTWIARRRNEHGKQEYRALGTHDTCDDAKAEAEEWARNVEQGVTTQKTTVKEACALYVGHLKLHKGAASSKDAEGRFRRLVDDDPIGRVALDKLRTSHLKTWVAKLVDADGQEDEDDLRRAKDSTNRNLASLKAALNLALKDRLVATDAAWKTVVPFRGVGQRRKAVLDTTQRKTLLDACPHDLRRLASGLLLTGVRCGELAAANVADFDKANGTITLDGKTGKRTVAVSTAAIAFFTECSKGRVANAPLLMREDGERWNKDMWKKVFRQAVTDAGLPDDVVIYTLRHTGISEMILGGMDSFVVATLAGTSVAMIEKHYGHLRTKETRRMLDAVTMI
jgi:integrase